MSRKLERLRLAIWSVDLALEDRASFAPSITEASGAEAGHAS